MAIVPCLAPIVRKGPLALLCGRPFRRTNPGKRIAASQQAMIAADMLAGMKIASGTGAAGYPHSLNVREFGLNSQAGDDAAGGHSVGYPQCRRSARLARPRGPLEPASLPAWSRRKAIRWPMSRCCRTSGSR